MFTIADIRNIAIQIEKTGKRHIEMPARPSGTPILPGHWTGWADEEQRHSRWFETIRSTRPLTQEQREMEVVGRTLLQDMVKGNTFLLDQRELERGRNRDGDTCQIEGTRTGYHNLL